MSSDDEMRQDEIITEISPLLLMIIKLIPVTLQLLL